MQGCFYQKACYDSNPLRERSRVTGAINSRSTADNGLQLHSSYHWQRLTLNSSEAPHMGHQDNNEIKLI